MLSDIGHAWTERNFFILLSQPATIQGDIFSFSPFFFCHRYKPPSFFFFLRPGHSHWVVNISGRRGWPRFHLIFYTHTHTHMHTSSLLHYSNWSPEMKPVPDVPSLSVSKSLSLPSYMSKSHFCPSVFLSTSFHSHFCFCIYVKFSTSASFCLQ